MNPFFQRMKQRLLSIFHFIKFFFINIFSKIGNSIASIVAALFAKLRAFKEYIVADRKRLIAFFLSFPLTAALATSGYFVFRKHYKIHSKVQSGLYTVPPDAEFYFEIKNTKSIKEILIKSETFQKIETSEAWTRFLSSLAGKKLGELLYLVELKSNALLDWKDFLELFGESIGYASFTDGTYSVVAKTNLKSRFGITMIESFKAEKIPLKKIKEEKKVEPEAAKPNEPVNPPQDAANTDDSVTAPVEEKENVISEENYEAGFLEEGIKNGNLIISQVEANHGSVYFVLVGEYLFLSDSLDTLSHTLEAATNPAKKSILANKEMDSVFKEYYKDDIQAVAYIGLSDTNFTPFLKPIAENANSISFLFKMENNLLTADILTTERKPFPNTNSVEINKIQSAIPNDVLLAIYSNSIGMKEYISSALNPGNAWTELSLMTPLFLQNGKLPYEEYFPTQSASAFLLHKPVFVEEEKVLYPEFTIGYVSPKEDDIFLKSIFKSGKATKESHLDENFKTYKRSGAFYSPSLYSKDKIHWLSSSVENTKDCIAAKNGNKPTISDLNSSKLSSPWKEAPHHVVLNWQRLREDILSFLIYGGIKSGKYTEKTVTSDIQPLLETFDWIESIHIALGAKGNVYGKMILSGM